MKTQLKKHIQPCIIFAFCLLAYTPTFFWMKIRWFARDSYYSHGILIPFVVGYLIWDKRKQLQDILKTNSSPSHPWGIPLIITGLLIHTISSVLRVYFTSGFSLLITIIGIILHFYGAKILKALAFPLFFLSFMIPLPEVTIVNISFRMKMFAASISARTINAIGILAIRDGSVIRMPHAYVIVDDVCSGLRSLISLGALGSIFAYFFKAPLWKRIALFLTTIPIAIITNVFRVVFLAFVSEVWGHEAASGLVHDFSGYSIFIIAFILLAASGKLLE
jgi:exosortase